MEKLKIDKKVIIKYGIIVLVVALLVIGGIALTKKEDKKPDNTLNNYNNISYDIVVEIKGEVNKPAIYTLPSDTRLQDLVNLAGGFTSNADTSSVNLAAKLTDGMVIVIPSKLDYTVPVNNKININTATITELISLNGIGSSTANKIIEYRNSHGLFTSIEEIKNVSGIGESLFNKIKDSITI